MLANTSTQRTKKHYTSINSSGRRYVCWIPGQYALHLESLKAFRGRPAIDLSQSIFCALLEIFFLVVRTAGGGENKKKIMPV